MPEKDSAKKLAEENVFLHQQNQALFILLNEYELFQFYATQLSLKKDPKDICNFLLEGLDEFFKKRREQTWSAVYLVKEDSLDFACCALHAPKKGLAVFDKELFKQIEQGIIAWSFNNKKPLNLKPLNTKKFNNLIVIPLYSSENILGIVLVYVSFKANTFSEENLKIINLFCLQAALYMDNLRATEAAKEKSEKLVITNKALQAERERANMANQAKSEFLANMSHEIRTPMTCVMGYAEMLQEFDLTDQQRRYVSSIHESGQVLLDLINDILNISKIEAKEIKLESIDFNLDYLVSSVIKIIRPKLKDKKIEIILNFDSAIPKDLKGDPTRIRQILLNLLGNAIKFTDEGKVTVSITIDKSVKITGDGKCTLKFAVKDTGIGIPLDKQDIIFKSFTQVDASTTRKYGGTGLGLSITKALVELMDGKIWVKSVEGKGSTFFFTLKLKSLSTDATKGISPVPLRKLQGMNVLIIDDKKDVRDILENFCKETGMSVAQQVPSVKTALLWLSRIKKLPDIILSDIRMPDIDGYELARSIRKEKKYDAIKLIAITSEAIPGVSKKSHESGFDGYLPKPINKKELLQVIRTVLGDKRQKGQIVTRHISAEISLDKLKILLVEDHLKVQALITDLLENSGCAVEIAGNGAEAIEKMKNNNNYHLILMDIQMPVMGGIEATKIIRKEINKNIPIIALTAFAMKGDREKCLKAGANEYLTKPIDPKKLKEAILNLVRK